MFEVIEYLKEIEARKLHLARGYSSMFAFATEFLGYSEAEAHIRIQAARLIQTLPEVAAKIQSGELSLSVAAVAQSHFRKENLRRKEQGNSALNIQEKRKLIDLVTGATRREAEQNMNSHFAQPSMKTLHINATPELMDKIEKLLNLMAHKNFDRDIGKMIELLVDAELERFDLKLEKAMKSESENLKYEGGPVAPEVTKRSRYISRRTRRLVWAKFKGECSYQDPIAGKKCQSKHGIQVDHRLAFSKGGSNRSENLTLLCSGHNAWKGTRQVERAFDE